jgi:hypothetical protein
MRIGFLLAPIAFLCSLLLIITSFLCWTFNAISGIIASYITYCLIAIKSKKFAMFIFKIVGISGVTGQLDE